MKPMELEQVLSDLDSEDEVDDDVADLEDRRVSLNFDDSSSYFLPIVPLILVALK